LSILWGIVKIFMKKRSTYETTEVAEKYSVSSKRVLFKGISEGQRRPGDRLVSRGGSCYGTESC